MKSLMYQFRLLTLSSTCFPDFQILSELHKLYLKFCGTEHYKIDILHWIVTPQLSGGQQHDYSTKQCRRAVPMSSLSILSCLQRCDTSRNNTGNPFRRGKARTIDLLLLSSSDQLLFTQKQYFLCLKQAILIRRLTVPSLPLQ